MVQLPAMETIYYSAVQSPVGPLRIYCSEKGLVRLEFAEGRSRMPKKWRLVKLAEKTEEITRQLDKYFHGSRTAFDLPLDLRGTEFQRRVWKALQRIPYGQTRSYAEVARQVGSPRAFRAVGQANNRNPVAIIVPCHRVVAAAGGLGGYGGGLPTKQFLLNLESGRQAAAAAT